MKTKSSYAFQVFIQLQREYIKTKDIIIKLNWTIISEKEITLDGLPAFQRTTLSNNTQKITYAFFMKNRKMYAIFAIPSKGKNFTTIETDLKMVLNTFRTL